ncbi:MAG TPA: PGPGW domain-containing protein [Candidatus Hydrogenedentes bacterium]|nr:PGPGW domain-containing protein [Candidatus Hydrogenedentota bacterium]
MDPIKHARRLIILVIGVTVMLAGLAMLVLPGPGVAVIVGALAILATEFVWAARLLKRVKENAQYAAQSVWNGARESRLSRIGEWVSLRKARPETPIE